MSRVYFIRQKGSVGPVKIGYSRTPERRLHQYMQWSPIPLEIVATCEGTMTLEGRFHAAFRHLHSHHEWFHWAAELGDVIARIQAGTFRPEELPPTGRSMRAEAAVRTWADRRAQRAA